MASSFTLPSTKPPTLTPPPPPPTSSLPPRPRSLSFRSDPSLPRFKLHASVNETSNNNAVITKEKPQDSEELPKIEPVVDEDPAVRAFLSQVSDLIKLVVSKDIVELELKQSDCEVVIRKKEALPQKYQPQPQMNPAPASGAPASSGPPGAASSGPPAAAPKASPSKPKHPPMVSPIVGTFYRRPAPDAEFFVEVGDKVEKGQIVCIVEAMKLMNEIEAETSGTIVEVVAENGQAVSVGSPLFIIEP